MKPSRETRDLARRLLAYEAVAGGTSVPTESAVQRVFDKLRRQLGALVGVAGFWSLASRALTLARAEAPSLSAVELAADGSLQGLGEPHLDRDHAEGGANLIAQVLGLLLTFIGETLTLRLMQDVWPDAAFDDPNSGTGEKHEH
jgi:hypothetical protein